MKYKFFIFLTLLNISLFSNNSNDILVKKFVTALIKRDKKILKNHITFVEAEDFAALWDIPKHSIPEEKELLQTLKKLKIQWLKVGDTINLSKGGTIEINANMVNETHKVALVELRGYGTPIQLIKYGEKWKIYPQLIIVNNRLRIKEQQQHIKQFNLIIANQNIPLNEDEPIIISINGKNYNVVLKNNNVIPYDGVLFTLFYNNKFHKFSQLKDEQEVLSLIGVESLRAFIKSFDNTITDDEVKKEIQILIEDIYFEEHISDKSNKSIMRNIGGLLQQGTQYITITDKNTYYDEIFIVKGSNYKFCFFLHTNFKDLSLFEKYFEFTLKSFQEIDTNED